MAEHGTDNRLVQARQVLEALELNDQKLRGASAGVMQGAMRGREVCLCCLLNGLCS